MSSNKWTENKRTGGKLNKLKFERDDDTVEKVHEVSTWGEWPGVATEETLKKFRVRVRYSEQTGELSAIYCPAYDSTCTKIIGYQKKDLTLDKNNRYHFLNCGTVNLKNPMFFQPQANPSSNHVYICEGFKDALALYQVIHDNTKPEWRKLIPPVVSITMGSPNAKMNILHNEYFIKQYQGTYIFKGETKKKGPILCFDNDESSPYEDAIKGKEATEETASALSSYDVKVLKHPDDINDIHDWIVKGRQKELYEQAVFRCVEYKPKRIVSLYDRYKPGELKKPIEKGVYLPSYPKLMDLMIGDRRGELTLFLAPSGVGKTTVTADMLYEYMVIEGYCGGVFLEEDLKKTFQRFIARRMEINLRDMRLGLSDIDPIKYKEAEEWAADPNNFLAVENEGKIKISELEYLAKMMVRKYNRKKIIIDHLMLTEGDKGAKKSEREQLDAAMETLAALCKEEKVSILLICHINRAGTKDRKRDITEPTWHRTFKEDARGSSAIECLSYNVICLDYEVLPSKRRGRIRLCLDKNREGGDTGLADCLIMDYKSGLMINAEDWVYDKEKGIMVPPDEISTGY